MTRVTATILALLELCACLTSGSPGQAEANVNCRNVEIAYINLRTIKQCCPEAAVADAVKTEAEAQLNSDLDRSKRILAKLQMEKVPDERIELTKRRLQANLNSELNALGKAIRDSNLKIQRQIAQAVDAVSTETGVQRVEYLEDNARPTGIAGALEPAKDITPEVVARLRLLRGGIAYGSESNGNIFDLVEGCVLFMPSKDMRVRTGPAAVNVPKGSAVWIVKTGSSTDIFDLHDSLRSGRPKLLANGKELLLSPGTEMWISGTRVLAKNFSIAQELNRIPIVRSMLCSKDSQQRQMAWKLIKDATILAER